MCLGLAAGYRKSKKEQKPRAMTAAEAAKRIDGLNSHAVIIDELHAIRDRNLYEVMKQSTSSRRQPLVVMITTAGTVRECIFDDMYELA